ncbi:hypothetical protein AB0F91_23230 [Amycolatopsis sp. NPDC023774]|uniref:hypothetical protein n=1 Tax=Amycolatopsis sp. NPDC023774 TaxID=3155015 RepID=UPI0033C7E94F
MAITDFPPAGSRLAADCEPVVAAAHFVVVWASSRLTALSVCSSPNPPRANPPGVAGPDVGMAPVWGWAAVSTA